MYNGNEIRNAIGANQSIKRINGLFHKKINKNTNYKISTLQLRKQQKINYIK